MLYMIIGLKYKEKNHKITTKINNKTTKLQKINNLTTKNNYHLIESI